MHALLLAPASEAVLKVFKWSLLLAGGSNSNVSEGPKGAQGFLYVLDALKVCLPCMPGKSSTSILKNFRSLLELRQPLHTRRITDCLNAVCLNPPGEICSEEYDKFTCMLLGVQAEVSVIALDLMMVLGTAHGLNVLFGIDLFTGVFLTALNAILFPLLATVLENSRAKFLSIYISIFILLSYILGVLVSQPASPISLGGTMTRLSGESAFALMSLLGANIMPHNFYLHSSVVQVFLEQTLFRLFRFVEKAKEENFFQLLQGYDELSTFNEPHNLRRLFIHSRPEDFKKSRLFCPRVRCLLFFDRSGGDPVWFNLSFVVCIFKLVRVLDLSQIRLAHGFPNEIQFLVQLRYLAVKGYMESIPSSIANLSNLEIFIVEPLRGKVLLPDAIWSLKKLRHVEMMHDDQVGFCFPTDSVDKSGERSNLVTFSVAILSWENIEMILRKFTNIRKLNLKLVGYKNFAENSNKILVLDFLSRLESLDVSPFEGYMYPIDFCFPLNLRKLSLSCFSLPWCRISTIGNLPNLEVLKLLIGSFGEESWHMEAAGEFPKLSFLKLSSLELCSWTASESEDHFPCLRKLVIEDCRKLQEVPSCFGYISTLETIEVSYCSESAASSVKQIQEEQMDMGNMDLKVLIHHPNSDSESP